ncbi:MAG: leucine-rich repeat protein [Clostridia bacterium]|nr:leucine-rich repeat protein [Clostridia bacterium]
MKKTIRKILFASLFVLTLSCLLSFSFTASAEVYVGDCGAEGDNVTWELDTETGVLTFSGEGKMAEDDVPDDIGEWYSYSDNIKKFVFEDNIETKSKPFYSTSALTEVVIGNNVVFSGVDSADNLKKITIGDNAVIGDNAFDWCYDIEEITIGENVTVGSWAFECGMPSDTHARVTIKSIKNAGEYAFCGCDISGTVVILDDAVIGNKALSPNTYDERRSKTLKKVIIGDNVSLGERALADNYALATVEVNGKFKYIGEGVFYGTKIDRASENYVAIDGALFDVNSDLAYIDDSYYIVAENIFSWKDAYFGFSKTKWNKINCGDENNGYLRKFNHKHSFEAEYDYREGTLKGVCICGVENEASYIEIQNLKATVTDTSVTLKWDYMFDASGYSVYRYDTAKKKWVNLEKECYDNSYKIKKLESDTEYKFAVRMFVEDEENKIYGTKYTEITVKTKLGKPELTACGGYKSIRLDWKAVDGADGYLVYKKVNGKWDAVKSTTKLYYTEKDLSSGKEYAYAVKAYELNGGKRVYAPSYSSVSVTAKLYNPKVTYERDIKSITLKWDKVTTATGYRIYQLVNGKWKAIKTTTATSYTVNKLKADTKYSFAVRSYVKVNGSTKWASSYTRVTVTTLDYTPIKATGLKGQYLSKTSVKISWNKSEDAVGYYLYRYNSSTKKYTVVAKTKNLSATLKDIDLSKTNYFTVRTYKKVDGKTYWSGYSAKYKLLSIPTSAEAVRIYNESEMQGEVWLNYTMGYDTKICNPNKSIRIGDNRYYLLNHKKINTVSAYKNHLYKYFDKKIIDDVVERCFVVRNGKVYVGAAAAGHSGSLNLSGTKFIGYTDFSEKGITYKVKIKLEDDSPDGRYSYYEEETVHLIQQNGRWVRTYDEFGLFLSNAYWPGSGYNPYNV